jgi:dihydrofolate reductase
MGRPLPGRPNIIITTQKDYQAPEDCFVAHSLDEALNLPIVKNATEAFVIGGSQIYDLAMPLVDKLYLTHIHTKIEGDTFFKYEPSQWKEVSSIHHPVDDKHSFAFDMTVCERT